MIIPNTWMLLCKVNSLHLFTIFEIIAWSPLFVRIFVNSLPSWFKCRFTRSTSKHIFICRRATTGGGPGGLDPCPSLQKDKSAFFLRNCKSSVKKCIDAIIIKLEYSESKKILVIFLPFLNLKSIIQSYILFKKYFSVPLFVD